MRTALVVADALFSDLADKRKPEYLDRIVLDALQGGHEMKQRVFDVIVFGNRLEQAEHGEQDVRLFLLRHGVAADK